MGLKNRIAKGKCRIGLHRGEWRLDCPTQCTFTRVCERCAVEHHRTEHVWQEWAFVEAQACEQSRACGRCAAPEERVSHAWGEPTYVSATACDQVRVCVRCEQAQPAIARHVFDHWEYTGADACVQVPQCSRCQGFGSQTRIEHVWGEWQHSNSENGAVGVCRRCGDLRVRTLPDPEPSAPPEEFYDLDEVEEPEDDAPASSVVDETVAYFAASSAPQPASRQDGHDRRLEGHWRCTPPALSSGGYTLSTDIHLLLDDEGRFARWNRSFGPMGEIPGDKELGSWTTQGATLALRYDDGTGSERTYEVQSDDLLFPGEGEQAYWVRVG